MPMTPTFKDYIQKISMFDNSNTKKEGCNCTYMLKDGFVFMFAYIGSEGYMLNCEFREGKTHSYEGICDFLGVCIRHIKLTLDVSVEDIMEICHMHGTCE